MSANKASDLAKQPLLNAAPPKKRRQPRSADQIQADLEREQDERDAKRDLALWAEATPQTKDEARYYGNLKYRFTKGITNAEIKAMTIRDRMEAARKCFEIQQLLLEKPTQNIRFQDRQDMDAALPALQAELERRRRERGVIELNPKEDYREG